MVKLGTLLSECVSTRKPVADSKGTKAAVSVASQKQQASSVHPQLQIRKKDKKKRK